MNLIYFSSDDLAWMRRRLLGSAQIFAAMTLLASMLQGSPPVPAETSRGAAPYRASISMPAAATVAMASGSPRALDSAKRRDSDQTIGSDETAQRQPNPVPPVGWRRTSNGWEHVSSWPTAPPSLHELIDQQRAEEPAWAQGLFRRLRGIPPVGFALFQLTAVALIALTCEIKRVAA